VTTSPSPILDPHGPLDLDWRFLIQECVCGQETYAFPEIILFNAQISLDEKGSEEGCSPGAQSAAQTREVNRQWRRKPNQSESDQAAT
jgi:hypothetical protein